MVALQGNSNSSSPLSSDASGSTPNGIMQVSKVESTMNRVCIVEVPILPPEVKRKYIPLSEVSMDALKLRDLDEIVGDHDDGRVLFYFARWQDGIISRFPERPLKAQYPQLVEAYLKRKASGTLAEFDPSAEYVHPTSRVRNVVKVDVRRRPATYSVASGSTFFGKRTSDNAPSDSNSDDEISSDDNYENNGVRRPIRRILRSSRPHSRHPKDLPFSPRKLRSRAAEESDAEEDEVSDMVRPTRRSTRVRQSVRGRDNANYIEDSQSNDDGSEDSALLRKRKVPKTKIVRGKASRPAYGHFRTVGDLDYDPCSDEETAALRIHRSICEKCHLQPAHELLNTLSRKKSKGPRKKTSDDEIEEFEDDKDKFENLGGWVRCLKCPVSAHWRCLAGGQRDEILKAARDRDREEWRRTRPHDEVYDEKGDPKPHPDEPGKREGLNAYQITEFICGSCMKGGICMGCMDTALEPDATLKNHSPSSSYIDGPPASGDVEMADATMVPATTASNGNPPQLLFRCFLCKRLAHYAHLPRLPGVEDDEDLADIALAYQADGWKCADCLSYEDKAEHILAWRPYPPNAAEPSRSLDEPLNHKSPLPREYLVKWVDRSYRRVQWVPHMWLVATHLSKLKNFLTDGNKVELLAEPVLDETADFNSDKLTSIPNDLISSEQASRASSVKPVSRSVKPLPDAEKHIPPQWKTVDRVLDIVVWSPEHQRKAPSKARRKPSRRQIASDDNNEEDETEESLAAFNDVFKHGKSPPDGDSETVEEWEARTGKLFSKEDISRVVYGLFKWADLGYDDATWDSPPRPGEPYFLAFSNAIERFIRSRSVFIAKGSKSTFDRTGNWERDGHMKHHRKDVMNLDLGQHESLKLMDFQRDGFNWLCNNWWNLQHCILADEMGLGKTVQIATFLGYIIKNYNASPALVVVPNSTIMNWVREFERWAPNLRVVPYYGESRSREIIKRYELFHKEVDHSKYAEAKFHVLITTYDTITHPKDFGPVFKKQPRWEVLVVDEGQRLKNDHSLLFRKLNELKGIHRIIMTGTPLNNNIRELFNLMNFLDPQEWHDLNALEKEYAELNDDLVKQLHNKLRPYFLRRIKSEVLKLPPKNEVIVPVSMTSLQKELYKSILSRDLNILKDLTSSGLATTKSRNSGKVTNLLMEMRKCLQHPYLISSDIEPRNLSAAETHDKLIDASAKFRLLKQLLPKLQARGHRILLFSQFVIALDVIEDFIVGEGYKCLRLDGLTKSGDRQKSMDEFNKPGSDVFIFLLSTRAGGVGINLYSADTVIIFDPDFNPHQAIARAHRYGQQKTVMVFKLMVKDSAEDRIMQVGKTKLALEHLVVKKMEDDDSAGEDIRSILTYGAKSLFDAGTSRDIIYSDADLDKLIDKTEEESSLAEEKKPEGSLTFEFAKIWSTEKDSFEEVEDVTDQGDAWAQALQKIVAEREAAKGTVNDQSGRGTRRRAAALTRPGAYKENPSPPKSGTRVAKSPEGSDYGGPRSPSSASSASSGEPNDDPLEEEDKGRRQKRRLSEARSAPLQHAALSRHPQQQDNLKSGLCSLCGMDHGDREGDCAMTAKSDYLVQYRLALMTSTDDEDLELRREAIKAIDETLYKRGHIHFIQGQPLYLIENLPNIPTSGHVPRPPASTPNTIGGVQRSMHVDQPSLTPSIVAGTSKQALASRPDAAPKKRKTVFVCPVCNEHDYHLVKDCPVVSLGPSRVASEITRLDKDPSKAEVVNILRNIYIKMIKREPAP